jgi:hypothetical protein
VKADAGKRRGAVERLLIEHARLNKTRGQLARLQIGRAYYFESTDWLGVCAFIQSKKAALLQSP